MVDGTARTLRPAARLIAAAGLVLGLVAMHGLVSDHHAPGPEAPAATSHDVHLSGSVTGHIAHAAAALSGSGCTPGCGDGFPAALCLAVLATAAVCLSSGRNRRHAVCGVVSRFTAAFVALRRGPPRLDPVSQLCVSRT